MRDELPQFAAVGASVLFCEMEIIRVIVCQTRFHVLYTHQVFILTIVEHIILSTLQLRKPRHKV